MADDTVRELGRLLREATQPEHAYWKREDFFSAVWLERGRAEGRDMAAECAEILACYRAAFGQVADMIDLRLARGRGDAGATAGEDR